MLEKIRNVIGAVLVFIEDNKMYFYMGFGVILVALISMFVFNDFLRTHFSWLPSRWDILKAIGICISAVLAFVSAILTFPFALGIAIVCKFFAAEPFIGLFLKIWSVLTVLLTGCLLLGPFASSKPGKDNGYDWAADDEERRQQEWYRRRREEEAYQRRQAEDAQRRRQEELNTPGW